jgi:hypothetical protein
MRNDQLEAWVLRIVDQVSRAEHIEDSRVELKANWPSTRGAARRVAGHANAAPSASVLWIIGLDETRGVVPQSHVDLADWLNEFNSEFDGIAPDMTDLVVPSANGSVVALLFDASRRPYVVKNPVYGSAGGGPVSLEVPWRDGTAIRSAKREDLIRLLAPVHAAPVVEILDAQVGRGQSNRVNAGVRISQINWHVSLTLYVTPQTTARVVFPKHKATLRLQLDAAGESPVEVELRFETPGHPTATGFVRDTETIRTTGGEAIVDGPGRLLVSGYLNQPSRVLPHADAIVSLELVAAGTDVPARLVKRLTLTKYEEASGEWR